MKWENRRQSCNIEDRRGLDAVSPVSQFFNKIACEVKNEIMYDKAGMALSLFQKEETGSLDALFQEPQSTPKISLDSP